ncbi:hypothetical protein WJX77_002060 [Trebouxia sp. C0004]
MVPAGVPAWIALHYEVQTLSILRGVLQYHIDFSCKVQAVFTMGDFATVGQLEAFLCKLNADYTKYAASLWDIGEVRCQDHLANADKEDLISAGVTSAIHATDIRARARTQGGPQRAVDKTSRKYEPVEDEISLARYVDSLMWHVWKCMDVYDQGPKLGEDKTSESELEIAIEELSTKMKEWGQLSMARCSTFCAMLVLEYVVDLEPVGRPVLSKYSDHRPRCSRELKHSIRCILHALERPLHTRGTCQKASMIYLKRIEGHQWLIEFRHPLSLVTVADRSF